MKNYWIKSGFYTLLQRGGGLVFGFGGFYLLIRLLNQEDFGAWALFVSITALIEVARNGLIQNGLIKFSVAANREESEVIQTAGLFLNVSLTFFSCAFLVVAGPMLAQLWHLPKVADLFLIYCITTIILIPFQHFTYMQQASFDFKSMSIMNLIRQGLFFGMIVLCFLMHINLTLDMLSLFLLVASGLATIYGYFSVKQYLIFSTKIDWSWVNKLFQFGKYSFGTNASGMIFNSMDQMMLGALLGSAAVATYNASSKINNLLDVPISTMSSIVFPHTTLNATNKEAIKNMYEKSVAALLVFLIPVVLISLFIPKLILTFIAGTAYAESSNILIVILLFSLLQPFIRQFGTVLDAYNRPGLNFMYILFSALLNLVLNFILIKQFGVIGAAFGTLISLLIATILNLLLLNKLFGVHPYSIIQCMKVFLLLLIGKSQAAVQIFLHKYLAIKF